MTEEIEPRFFFVHVMKTGGATFRQHLYANFGGGRVFPRYRGDDIDRAWLIDTVLTLRPKRLARTRAIAGHFPFVVTQLLDLDFVTITMLRDPVERTISYLKHCSRYNPQHQGMRFEQIYEDPFFFPCFIQNHQSKMFAMTKDDKLESYADVIDIDDKRLKIAIANLDLVDVLGLTERYTEFLDEVGHRFGWHLQLAPNLRVSEEDWEPSPAFRRRIAQDNEADLEFYAHATALHEKRRRWRSVE
jgi:hypothetical protein